MSRTCCATQRRIAAVAGGRWQGGKAAREAEGEAGNPATHCALHGTREECRNDVAVKVVEFDVGAGVGAATVEEDDILAFAVKGFGEGFGPCFLRRPAGYGGQVDAPAMNAGQAWAV